MSEAKGKVREKMISMADGQLDRLFEQIRGGTASTWSSKNVEIPIGDGLKVTIDVRVDLRPVGETLETDLPTADEVRGILKPEITEEHPLEKVREASAIVL